MPFLLGFSYYWPVELRLLLGLQEEAASALHQRILANLGESLPPALRGDPADVRTYRRRYFHWLITAWGRGAIETAAQAELDVMVAAVGGPHADDDLVVDGESEPEPCPEGFVTWEGECVPYEVHDFPEDVIDGDPYDPEFDFEDFDPCEDDGVCFEMDEEGNVTEVDCCPPFLCC